MHRDRLSPEFMFLTTLSSLSYSCKDKHTGTHTHSHINTHASIHMWTHTPRTYRYALTHTRNLHSNAMSPLQQ